MGKRRNNPTKKQRTQSKIDRANAETAELARRESNSTQDTHNAAAAEIGRIQGLDPADKAIALVALDTIRRIDQSRKRLRDDDQASNITKEHVPVTKSHPQHLPPLPRVESSTENATQIRKEKRRRTSPPPARRYETLPKSAFPATPSDTRPLSERISWSHPKREELDPRPSSLFERIKPRSLFERIDLGNRPTGGQSGN